jgi:hypothetical protein
MVLGSYRKCYLSRYRVFGKRIPTSWTVRSSNYSGSKLFPLVHICPYWTRGPLSLLYNGTGAYSWLQSDRSYSLPLGARLKMGAGTTLPFLYTYIDMLQCHVCL